MQGKPAPKYVKWLWIVALSPFGLLFLMLTFTALGLFGRMPSFEELENPRSNIATEIYSADGKVLGKRSEAGSGALIRGIELQTPEVGQKIVPAEGSERRVEQLLELLAALEEKGMLPGVSGIDFSQDGVISMDYAQRFAVKFAYGADFSYKLAQLNKVIEQLEAQGDMRDGTIDMTNETDGRINFIPD